MMHGLLWLLLAVPLPAQEVENLRDALISVGIAHRAPHIMLRTEGAFRVIDQKTGEIHKLAQGTDVRIEADADAKLLIGPHLLSGPTRLLPGKSGEHVVIDGRRYGGNIVFRPNKDETVTVIDELGIEEYLLGVIAKEMSPEWPLEALKAQAIVSRTFALNNLGKFKHNGFDLSNDDRSQLYTGLTDINPRIKRAVKQTRGQILSWRGKIMPVYFHSTCGGHTVSPGDVWGDRSATPAPLTGVRCRYCKHSPHYRWQAYFRGRDILRHLQRTWNVTRLDRIRIGAKGSNGILVTLNLKLDRMWKTIRANKFRLLLGAAELKSTRIYRISRKSRGWHFRGKGYGHGVGLCQWGARVQAVDGREYRRILRHYFPGAKIRRLAE
jgi:stage II sporulation protein D